MKGFFRNFTGAVYDFNTLDFKSQRVVVDITRSIGFNDIGDVVRYDKYYIDDGETADSVAYKLFGDPTKHWILYLLNPDLKNGWPFSNAELEKLIENKYGSYSFLALDDEDVYNNIDFNICDSAKVYLNENDINSDVNVYQFDYSRRALITSQKPNDTEWMKNLETIFIKLFKGKDQEGNDVQVGETIELAVNPDNCRYLMKNAVYSYVNKSYYDALENGDGPQTELSFEEYEVDYNERKKYIRVLNKADAERVSQQYFAILKDV